MDSPAWLRQETRAGAHVSPQASAICLENEPGAYRIPVAFRSSESDLQRLPSQTGAFVQLIPQDTKLWFGPKLEDQVEISVLVDVERDERAPVAGKVQAAEIRNVLELSTAMVEITGVPLVAAPRAVRAYKNVNRAPAVLIAFGSNRLLR